MTLSNRDQEILQILISDYIASAQPVGSKAIATHHSRLISPATIRNVMADLEQRGYLLQPHTSAGRIPTEKGMRYYVDCLLKVRDLDENEKEQILNRYAGVGHNIDSLLKRTSNILSAISKYAGIVASPKVQNSDFKHIEFIRLSHKRLLGIFVTQTGLVQNRIIECNEEFSYSDLDRINNYCNSAFLGLTLSEALTKAKKELGLEQIEYDKLLKKAMLMSHELLSEIPTCDVLIEGEERLLNNPEFTQVESIKKVLEALEQKQQIVQLLDRCLDSEGVKIFIGAESGITAEGMSFVAAPYKQGNKTIGTIGVIGPTRMDYSRVIPVVDFTSKLISDLMDMEV